jgi:hypothetical protein
MAERGHQEEEHIYERPATRPTTTRRVGSGLDELYDATDDEADNGSSDSDSDSADDGLDEADGDSFEPQSGSNYLDKADSTGAEPRLLAGILEWVDRADESTQHRVRVATTTFPVRATASVRDSVVSAFEATAAVAAQRIHLCRKHQPGGSK